MFIPIRKKNTQEEALSAEVEYTKMYMSIRAPDRRIGDLFAGVFKCGEMQNFK
jgi:hypothetical protein